MFKALVMMERLSGRYADHVIISNHIWGKTILTMNYPDESIFYQRPKERNDGRFVMIYPGTLGWHQGVDIAVRAFALIKDKIPMAVVGSTRVLVEAKKRGLIDNVGASIRSMRDGGYWISDSIPLYLIPNPLTLYPIILETHNFMGVPLSFYAAKCLSREEVCAA